VSQVIKLSSTAAAEFWEIPILYEDEHLLALDKPPGLWLSPDRSQPGRPSLVNLLHRDLARGAAWATQRRLVYLMHSHRLGFAVSGVVLLAKDKPTLAQLAAQFGSEKPVKTFVVLARGAAPQGAFYSDAPLAPHPARPGYVRVDLRHGKRARTEFSARESFDGYVLLECRPLTDRPDQVQAHLKNLRLPLVGDEVYGGPPLLLSSLKAGYHLKPGRSEKPLISRAALHVERLAIHNPADGQDIIIEAPWPKDLAVSVKYLRRFAQTA
jgi:23S rRNA-/tRNA-specific pseudouridylate synthase